MSEGLNSSLGAWLGRNPVVSALACFAIIEAVWLWEEIAAAQSVGEKDLGVGILFMMAMAVTTCVAPFGLAFVVFAIARHRHQRRLQRKA
jgi:glycerol-3-phosphate acyltransferase PlsY